MMQRRLDAVTVIYCDANNEYRQAEVTEYRQAAAGAQCNESVELRTENSSLTSEDQARRYARFVLADPTIVVEWEPPA